MHHLSFAKICNVIEWSKIMVIQLLHQFCVNCVESWLLSIYTRIHYFLHHFQCCCFRLPLSPYRTGIGWGISGTKQDIKYTRNSNRSFSLFNIDKIQDFLHHHHFVWFFRNCGLSDGLTSEQDRRILNKLPFFLPEIFTASPDPRSYQIALSRKATPG